MGTHAFLAYQNIFGVKWDAGAFTVDLDFLTTFGRGEDKPLFVPTLNLTKQPLKFMEFSLEAPIKATLVHRNGPLVVNVPRPERYIWHKLIVYGERPREMRAKANKDLAQVACMLDYLLENDADLIRQSWHDAIGRGPGWKQRLLEGWKGLNSKFASHAFEAHFNASKNPHTP